MESETTRTVATVLSAIGEIFTSAIGWAAKVAETIASEPLLLIFVVVPLVGLGVGLFKRLLNV